MKKLLWLSDSPLINTGYATISRNILNDLSKDYECHFLAHNYVGQTLSPGSVVLQDGFKFNFWLHGAGRQAYQQDLIVPKIHKYQAEYFGVLLDTFMLYPWGAQMNFSPAKTFFYFPSDGGGGLPRGCESVLRNFRNGVAMSKFAQRQVKEKHNLDVAYIPHAVHQNIYYPVSAEEKRLFRKNFVVQTVSGAKVKGFLADKFVVGVVARNQSRKMLDRSLRSFAKFCKDKPEVVFFMKTDLQDAAASWDILELIRRLGIENRVVFSPVKFYENYEYSEMNQVYNVMDIFFLSTSGEGFGVPTLEAMACGVPVVVTDYTTTQELLMEHGQCGLPVKCESEVMGSWTVDRGLMDEAHGAECLNKLYHSPEMRDKFGEVGRAKVLNHYTWDIVSGMWRSFLASL